MPGLTSGDTAQSTRLARRSADSGIGGMGVPAVACTHRRSNSRHRKGMHAYNHGKWPVRVFAHFSMRSNMRLVRPWANALAATSAGGATSDLFEDMREVYKRGLFFERQRRALGRANIGRRTRGLAFTLPCGAVPRQRPNHAVMHRIRAGTGVLVCGGRGRCASETPMKNQAMRGASGTSRGRPQFG